MSGLIHSQATLRLRSMQSPLLARLQPHVSGPRSLAQCQRRGAGIVRCSFGSGPNFRPPGGGGNFDGPGGGRFSPPGMDNENFTRTSGGLIIPSSLTGTKNADEAAAKPNEMASFRPPVESLGLDDDGAASDEERLMRLSRRQGAWFELATTLQFVLARYPPTEIDERTGITQKEQNLLVGAYKVRRTLIDEGVVTNDVVSYFNTIDAAELLYEFRTIPVELRGIMAQTIVEEGLDKPIIVEVVRGIKEYDARDGLRTQFERTPRDCYAFNVFRMINVSVMREPEVRQLVEKALKIGVSESGKAALDKIIGFYEGDTEETGATEVRGVTNEVAKLPLGRLSGDDIHSFIIPVVGTLDKASANEFEAVQAAGAGSGPFSVKTIAAAGKYATIPQLSVLRTALEPVVVMVDDRRTLPTQNKGLQEPAMLVIDRGSKRVEDSKFYLARNGLGLQVVVGGSVPDSDILGKIMVVLFMPTENTEEGNIGQEIVDRMLNPGGMM